MSYEIASTDLFDKWLRGLKDRTTKNKVLARLARVENGNFGDFKHLNGGLRIYYTIRNQQVVLLLSGGASLVRAVISIALDRCLMSWSERWLLIPKYSILPNT